MIVRGGPSQWSCLFLPSLLHIDVYYLILYLEQLCADDLIGLHHMRYTMLNAMIALMEGGFVLSLGWEVHLSFLSC